MKKLAIWVVWMVLFLHVHGEPKPFETWQGCRYETTPWADGDSFRIVRPDGEKVTVRLYGADCMEWHVASDTDARRLRAQRRYFGITTVGPRAGESIEMAKGFGKAAAEFTSKKLAEPFVVHCRRQKALGDGKYVRFYAFITCSDGTDLATELVRAGWARAFGVCADGPGERTKEEYRESLQDIELQAAKKGRGIWEHTDWEKLPIERLDQRRDDEELEIAIGNGKLPNGLRLDPNTAARDDLMKLPRVGETMADRIIEARDVRPFEKTSDLLRVPGIGEKTLKDIQPFLEFGK